MKSQILIKINLSYSSQVMRFLRHPLDWHLNKELIKVSPQFAISQIQKIILLNRNLLYR